MIAFLDTEFTGLFADPKLLSVGIVLGAGEGNTKDSEFYAEVTDPERLHAASWFVLDAVLPQFGKVPGAATTYFAAQRLAPFSRHHALCDARALRASYAATQAVDGAESGASPCAPPHRPQAPPFDTTAVTALPRRPHTESLPTHESES